MTSYRAVGVVVTNPARARFVVQRKDASYPRYPRGYSLFGGACEAGESDEAALARELHEELGETSARELVDAGLRRVQAHVVGDAGFVFVLFEAVVDDATLDVIAARPVFEGERAELVARTELVGLAWIWGLEAVISAYAAQL